MNDGRKLAIKRTNGIRLKLRDSGTPDPGQEIMIAGWQSEQHGVPMRCVVRVDGKIQGPAPVDDNDFNVGYPCAVLKVDYSIGGMVRTTLIDAVNQSALVVWAESIEVVAVWDRRRIDRLESFYSGLESTNPGPCLEQLLACAISVSTGDTGAADARYLDVVAWDNSEAGQSVHPIPPGARGVRLLNASDTTGTAVLISDALTAVKWGNERNGEVPYIHQEDIECLDCGCVLDVPAGTGYLTLDLAPPAGPVVTLASPFFIEWILAPGSI